MAIKKYPKGANIQIATNFKSYEFDCQGRGCCSETPIDSQLVEYLQQIRDYFKKPVILTAYRCPVHNASIPNAATKSRHMYGEAADLHINGVSPKDIAKYAETIGVKGIGLYDTASDGHFVHIDTRTTKSFWLGHAQKRVDTFGGNPPKEKLEVDGIWGQATTKASQEVLKTPVDGIVSNQSENQKQFLPAASTSSWQFKPSSQASGSALISAIQKLVGANQDGVAGYQTVCAMQTFLKQKKYYTGNVDGIMGSNTVSAWQCYIRDQQ